MPYEQYISKDFRPRSLVLIEHANEIIAEYQAQGFSLTLRQLYYQFVARDIIPNTQRDYKNLGSLINDARLAGEIDWNAIEDRTRNVDRNAHWDSAADLIETCESQFAFDKWAEQPYAVEVWIEKEALIGVIEGVCRKLDVPRFACRGYSSQSERWRAGKRFETAIEQGREPIILHLGDHDPSGIDMTRDNADRLSMFAGHPGVEVRRLALNWDQVKEYRPPPNPAKLTDSRAKSYISNFGKNSWELDALSPTVIADLIETEIISLRDDEIWDEAVKKEDAVKARFCDFRHELEDEE